MPIHLSEKDGNSYYGVLRDFGILRFEYMAGQRSIYLKQKIELGITLDRIAFDEQLLE